MRPVKAAYFRVMRLTLASAMVAGAFLYVGCGTMDLDSPLTGGSEGNDGTGGSGGTSGVGGAVIEGTLCNEDGGPLCPSGFYCRGECSYSFPSQCTSAPETCEEVSPRPSCGCDGQVYASQCEARRAGVEPGGECDPSLWPEGLFPCKTTFCDLASEYCMQQLVAGEFLMVYCDDMPLECADLPAEEACRCIVSDPRFCEATCCDEVNVGDQRGLTLFFNTP